MIEVETSGDGGSTGLVARACGGDPDPAMLADAGRQANWSWRACASWSTSLLLLVPVGSLVAQPGRCSENWIGFGVTLIGAALDDRRSSSRCAATSARAGSARSSTIFDVTLVSAALLTLHPHRPAAGRDQLAAWRSSATSSPSRRRACATTRACASSPAGWRWRSTSGSCSSRTWLYDLSSLTEQIRRYGDFDWGSVGLALLVLAIAAALQQRDRACAPRTCAACRRSTG